MTARRLAHAAVAALLVVGCNGTDTTSEGEPTSAATTAAATGSATPTSDTATEPTAPATSGSSTTGTAATAPAGQDELPQPDTNDKEAAGFPDPAGPTSFLETVEIGDHEDYERVVFTFTEDSAVPSWRVAYVDEISESGSGRPVEIAGEAFLSVTLSGASGVDLTSDEVVEVYTGPERLAGSEAGASVVQEVVKAGDFEAVMDWGIGLDGERPFRVFTLEDPSRVVVDVATD